MCLFLCFFTFHTHCIRGRLQLSKLVTTMLKRWMGDLIPILRLQLYQRHDYASSSRLIPSSGCSVNELSFNAYVFLTCQYWRVTRLRPPVFSPSPCLCSPSPRASPLWEASCWRSPRSLIDMLREALQTERNRGMKVTHCSGIFTVLFLIPLQFKKNHNLPSREI